MDYNDFDSNGNRKDRDYSFSMSDKKSRSRVILLVYLVLIVFLIIVLRINGSGSKAQDVKDKTEQEQKEDNKDIKENVLEMFSLIDQNNYNFKVSLEYNYKNEKSIQTIDGKRYNNKFDFNLSYNNENIHFLGTENYIRAKQNEESSPIKADFPYVELNFFDNKVLEKILSKATEIEGIYEITNEDLVSIIDSRKVSELENGSTINKIVLTVQNNKVTSFSIDYSNALSDYQKDKISAVVTIEYSNFGLVEDFSTDF